MLLAPSVSADYDLRWALASTGKVSTPSRVSKISSISAWEHPWLARPTASVHPRRDGSASARLFCHKTSTGSQAGCTSIPGTQASRGPAMTAAMRAACSLPIEELCPATAGAAALN